ncbi:copper-translocating P-type ATPase [Secundilactobacillus collinoides]|uniref:P-type Cu(+) transporter n=2 Tax=Secundilactobacillus collinoides TaxID=33960 RepID=A0A0R2BHA5_SECCO|nr:copper transporting atpase [Secundilactobacillus collinoides DSM 20515 = JCM 1123]
MKMSGEQHETMHDMADMARMNHDKMSMPGGAHMMMDTASLRRKFWISLILTIPIVLFSPMMGMTLPFQMTFSGSDWLVALIGSFIFVYGGQPFFSGAREELKTHQPAMMTLITMGISVAYVYSIYAVIANDVFVVTPTVTDFFWELATLIDIMLLGHWIEMGAVMNAGSAVDKLAKLLPDTAHLVVEDGTVQDVKVGNLQLGQHVQIRAGEKIPADGTVLEGATSVDEAMVTGEAKAVAKQPTDTLIGGTINGTGTVTIVITGTGDTGYLSKVMTLVQSAQDNKSQTETMADKVAGYLFYAALIVGVGSFVIWLMTNSLAAALSIAVTVFVIACPHALGLAIPLVVARVTSLAATNGLLIANRSALEQINRVRFVLMDKTGTLTAGKFSVNAVQSFTDQFSENDILGTMAALEGQSTHPLATGIISAAKAASLQVATAANVRQQTGIGLMGDLDGHHYQIVSPTYVAKHNLTVPSGHSGKRGDTLSYLVGNEQVLGLVAQGDQIKSEAPAMIQQLKHDGLTPVMLTGDNRQAAQAVAAALGIDDVQAELMPEDKDRLVTGYQKHGGVLFVGDGVNDAPSLARADIGVAIGSGTDVAIDSADVVLVNSNPYDIVKLIVLAKTMTRKMTQNIWWGAGYNIVAIPLAAGILAPIGFILSPMVGAVLMSLSTVIVALNALTIRRV